MCARVEAGSLGGRPSVRAFGARVITLYRPPPPLPPPRAVCRAILCRAALSRLEALADAQLCRRRATCARASCLCCRAKIVGPFRGKLILFAKFGSTGQSVKYEKCYTAKIESKVMRAPRQSVTVT